MILRWRLTDNCDYLFDIPDFTAPTQEQIIRFIEIVIAYDTSNKFAIHCLAGKGRTGTMLAALGLIEIFEKSSVQSLERNEVIEVSNKKYPVTNSVSTAINKIRSIENGAGSVETISQLESLMVFEKFYCAKLNK